MVSLVVVGDFAVSKACEHIHGPKWAIKRHLNFVQRGNYLFHLRLVTRKWHRVFDDVVVNVEIIVVNPDRVIPVARHESQFPV